MKQGKANRVLQRECTGNSKHPLPTTQDKTTHGHHQMVNTKIRLIILFAAKCGGALYSQQKQDQELTGSDHELLIAKFRQKLKVEKTTRLFRYDLNQIPASGSFQMSQFFVSVGHIAASALASVLPMNIQA